MNNYNINDLFRTGIYDNHDIVHISENWWGNNISIRYLTLGSTYTNYYSFKYTYFPDLTRLDDNYGTNNFKKLEGSDMYINLTKNITFTNICFKKSSFKFSYKKSDNEKSINTTAIPFYFIYDRDLFLKNIYELSSDSLKKKIDNKLNNKNIVFCYISRNYGNFNIVKILNDKNIELELNEENIKNSFNFSNNKDVLKLVCKNNDIIYIDINYLINSKKKIIYKRDNSYFIKYYSSSWNVRLKDDMYSYIIKKLDEYSKDNKEKEDLVNNFLLLLCLEE